MYRKEVLKFIKNESYFTLHSHDFLVLSLIIHQGFI